MSAECLVFDMIVDHPRVTLWKVIGEPELYPRFFRGVSWCEKVGPVEGRRSVRYRVRASLGDGALLDHHLETMINRPPEQLVFASVPDTGGWVSVRLHDSVRGRATACGGSAITSPEFQHRLRTEGNPWHRSGMWRGP